MLISEVTNLESKIHKIIGNQCKFQFLPDIDDAMWMWDSNLTPIVLLNKTIIETVFQQSSDFIEKYFNDPFLGLFPHEIEEANTTLLLMQFQLDVLKKKYPKFDVEEDSDWSNSIKRLNLKQLSFIEIKQKFALKRNIGNYEFFGGVAHEMIISPDTKKYNDWINHCYKLGV